MYDDMTLEDAMDLVARRRDQRIRRQRMIAWAKFAMAACAFAVIIILMR